MVFLVISGLIVSHRMMIYSMGKGLQTQPQSVPNLNPELGLNIPGAGRPFQRKSLWIYPASPMMNLWQRKFFGLWECHKAFIPSLRLLAHFQNLRPRIMPMGIRESVSFTFIPNRRRMVYGPLQPN